MFIYIIFPGVLAESDVSQSPQAVTGNENGNLSMECNTTVSVPTFHWYTQYGNGSIRFLVLGTRDISENDRISALANTRQRNCTLTIQHLRVSDAATYFCAASTVLRTHTLVLYRGICTHSPNLNVWNSALCRLCGVSLRFI
uniref:Ig-like domain-containing protein n=1 Tax=Callorhinchus milii TaxID=7868 RepID=A0A4W3IY56_CALMI